MENLWPDDLMKGVAPIITPANLLKHQASQLGEITNNIVVAEVSSKRDGDDFTHYFKIIAPALEYYTYTLFRLQHKIQLYPVDIIWEGNRHKIADQQQLMTFLKEILISDKTKHLVQALIAQST